ncbi:MAG: hypothetical protein RI910_102 [Verrucomicrobiota bacterium]|jgi:hypothetical protein
MGASPSVEKILAENLSPSEQWEYKFFKPLVWGASLSYIVFSVFIFFSATGKYLWFLLPLWIFIGPIYFLAVIRLCDRHHAIARKALANLKAKHATEAGMTPTSPA